MKEINQAMAARIKANKDIKRLTEERDAALQEYSLIMSERDSVHRELEKLTDDLGGSKKQIKSLETQNKELQDKVAGKLLFFLFQTVPQYHLNYFNDTFLCCLCFQMARMSWW